MYVTSLGALVGLTVVVLPAALWGRLPNPVAVTWGYTGRPVRDGHLWAMAPLLAAIWILAAIPVIDGGSALVLSFATGVIVAVMCFVLYLNYRAPSWDKARWLARPLMPTPLVVGLLFAVGYHFAAS